MTMPDSPTPGSDRFDSTDGANPPESKPHEPSGSSSDPLMGDSIPVDPTLPPTIRLQRVPIFEPNSVDTTDRLAVSELETPNLEIPSLETPATVIPLMEFPLTESPDATLAEKDSLPHTELQRLRRGPNSIQPVSPNAPKPNSQGSFVISTAQSPLEYVSQTRSAEAGTYTSGFGGPLAGAAADTNAPPAALPIQSRPKLIVLRGEKVNAQYPLYEGRNFLGRTDEKPVDIDLEEQESPERIWTSRQHACINYDNGLLTVEDLNSLNGTFVNRMRVHPGQQRVLQVNDIIQVGTVQMKVILG